MFPSIILDWHAGFHKDGMAAVTERVPAQVPGAVQLDWARAHGWGDYFYADNWKDYLWMEDVYWSYTSSFPIPPAKSGERIFFVCKGIDYQFIVKLNGAVIHEQEGMFTPFEIDITDWMIPENNLEILLFPAPKRKGASVSKDQADQCCKPPVSYGWDWHPRLIPIGIWEDTRLEIRPQCHIVDAEVMYDLCDDFSKADMKLHILLTKPGEGHLSWEVIDPLGNSVYQTEHALDKTDILLEAPLEEPCLWWPNGQGEPALYIWTVELFGPQGEGLQKIERKMGFRKTRLVMHPGAWNMPDRFPKTRSNPPITLEINGRQIFAKGTNWVNPEIFPGVITEETYRPLLQMAKDANMNILRSWGGGIINKDSFFDQCDELGIMVWQEFPLSCNNYEGSTQYLKILDQESRSIIKRLRYHPCIVLWCGGNELFNAWSGMTDQSLPLRLLNKNCYELDPKTPFIMTSPLMGMGHGSYLFRYHTGEEVFQVMPRSSFTAYTEFGCPSLSSAEYLQRFIPEEELFPPRPGTVWETHHAFNAWGGGDTWLCLPTLEHYFGPSNTLEEMVERSQLLQCEGYKCIYEEARRQKPTCSMALNWCYNEPWPTAANNSLVNWPAEPKPGFYAVKASCRPVLASARIPKFSWKEGEIFDPELWILNDSPDLVPGQSIKAALQIGDVEIPLLQWNSPELAPNTNMQGPVVKFVLPHYNAGRMKLILKVEGRPEMNSEYVLLYRPESR